jgi:putative transposase
MKNHAKTFPIEMMAKILQVSRSSYYLPQEPSKRSLENQEIVKKIKEIHKKSRNTYGSPRIQKVLEKEGVRCSKARVARLMQKSQIRAKMTKAWKRTTKQKQGAIAAPNHLDQNFKVDEPNKAWVSDITYIPTEEGWLYVSISLDLFSRKIIGLGMGNSLETSLVLKTLGQAFIHRTPVAGLMHHSDRGCQYTSGIFKTLMEKHQILLSMSGTGYCYDNAVAESFFHTLKTEHTNFYKYRTREEAMNSIFEYIEIFYNRERIHSTLGYISPVDYESLWEMKMCADS